MKWHQDYIVREKYRSNEVAIRKDGRITKIHANLEFPSYVWSKQMLAKHIENGNEAVPMLPRPVEGGRTLEFDATEVTPEKQNKDVHHLLREYRDISLHDIPKGISPERGKHPFHIEMKANAQPRKKGVYRASGISERSSYANSET